MFNHLEDYPIQYDEIQAIIKSWGKKNDLNLNFFQLTDTKNSSIFFKFAKNSQHLQISELSSPTSSDVTPTPELKFLFLTTK